MITDKFWLRWSLDKQDADCWPTKDELESPICMLVVASNSADEICLFHLVRLFWNQVFTWASLNLRFLAKLFLSLTDKYFFSLNLYSNDFSWALVNAVRFRLILREREESTFFEDWPASATSFSRFWFSSAENLFSLAYPRKWWR